MSRILLIHVELKNFDKVPGYVEHIEFGTDVWRHVIAISFARIKMHCFEYPVGIAIEASINE